MNKHQLSIRTWRDRTYGNTYFSFKLAIAGGPVIIRPMEYGDSQHAEWQAFKTLQSHGFASGAHYPSEVLDVNTREVNRSELFAHEWECIEHGGRAKPKGMRWAGNFDGRQQWRTQSDKGGCVEFHDTLTAARQCCTRAMARGATGRHIDRLCMSAVSMRFVPWVSYLQVKP